MWQLVCVTTRLWKIGPLLNMRKIRYLSSSCVLYDWTLGQINAGKSMTPLASQQAAGSRTTEKQGHRQVCQAMPRILTQTLIVCLLRTHLFSFIRNFVGLNCFKRSCCIWVFCQVYFVATDLKCVCRVLWHGEHFFVRGPPRGCDGLYRLLELFQNCFHGLHLANH